jgi:hypothetical protein
MRKLTTPSVLIVKSPAAELLTPGIKGPQSVPATTEAALTRRVMMV